MFGYLQPDKDELKIRDYKVYKSFYCGLCRQLGKDYGIIARLTLSYDCTLLALLSVSLKNEDCAFVNKRCVCNPLKKCCYCIGKNESMHFAGAVSVILTHYKFFDTLSDEGFFKKIAARFLLILFHGAFKRAVREYPEIDRLAQNMMSEQQKAEFDCVGIDRAAEPTANFLSGLCANISDDEKYLPELKKFCYLIGRWIYLADACDDLEKDVKKGSFNPFVSKYNGDVQETMKYCREVLNMTTAHIIMAYDRLPCHSYKAVTDNIIYYGLYAKQKWLTEEKYMKNIEGEKMSYQNDEIWSLITQEKFKEAEEKILLTENDSEKAEGSFLLSKVYEEKGWLESANEYAKKAYEIEPENEEYSAWFVKISGERGGVGAEVKKQKSGLFGLGNLDIGDCCSCCECVVDCADCFT